MLDLVNAGFMELADVTDITTIAVNQLGLSFDKAEQTVLGTAAALSKVNAKEHVLSFGQLNAHVKALSQSYKYLGVDMATLPSAVTAFARSTEEARERGNKTGPSAAVAAELGTQMLQKVGQYDASEQTFFGQMEHGGGLEAGYEFAAESPEQKLATVLRKIEEESGSKMVSTKEAAADKTGQTAAIARFQEGLLGQWLGVSGAQQQMGARDMLSGGKSDRALELMQGKGEFYGDKKDAAKNEEASAIEELTRQLKQDSAQRVSETQTVATRMSKEIDTWQGAMADKLGALPGYLSAIETWTKATGIATGIIAAAQGFQTIKGFMGGKGASTAVEALEGVANKGGMLGKALSWGKNLVGLGSSAASAGTVAMPAIGAVGGIPGVAATSGLAPGVTAATSGIAALNGTAVSAAGAGTIAGAVAASAAVGLAIGEGINKSINYFLTNDVKSANVTSTSAIQTLEEQRKGGSISKEAEIAMSTQRLMGDMSEQMENIHELADKSWGSLTGRSSQENLNIKTMLESQGKGSVEKGVQENSKKILERLEKGEEVSTKDFKLLKGGVDARIISLSENIKFFEKNDLSDSDGLAALKEQLVNAQRISSNLSGLLEEKSKAEKLAKAAEAAKKAEVTVAAKETAAAITAEEKKEKKSDFAEQLNKSVEDLMVAIKDLTKQKLSMEGILDLRIQLTEAIEEHRKVGVRTGKVVKAANG